MTPMRDSFLGVDRKLRKKSVGARASKVYNHCCERSHDCRWHNLRENHRTRYDMEY